MNRFSMAQSLEFTAFLWPYSYDITGLVQGRGAGEFNNMLVG
uniref:Uncharacterized protein n=1 Tax=Anguilla anguilla TaxID=7936 RepID=A0A0E9QFB2_ANGAN